MSLAVCYLSNHQLSKPMLLTLEIMSGTDWTPNKTVSAKLKSWQQEGFVTTGTSNMVKSPQIWC